MSIKTKLPYLLFLLLLSLTLSHAFYRKRLLCLQHCQTQQHEDSRQCEKHLGGRVGETELARCQHQTQDEERRCEKGCQRAADEEMDRGEHKPPEETVYKFYAEEETSPFSTQEGYIAVERFDTRSELLEGLRDYRFVLTRVNPDTFVVPSHRNADFIAIVSNGDASVTIIQQDKTETHNVKLGDIFRIPAGSIVHFVNTHSNIQLFHLLEITVNTPPHLEYFFTPGSRDQESVLNAFSNEILQAAFNLDKDQVRKLFQGRNELAFVKASHEQIKALVECGDQESSKSSSSRPYNIFNKRPSLSNKYGEVYEVYPQDYPPIQDLDIKVTYINITKGSMFGPYYNSRSTILATVIHGRGYVQMMCREQEEQGTSYQKVRAEFVNGDYFIVPAGCPFVMIALEAKNLQVVSFEVRAQNNRRVALAGKNNILKQLQKEAKELSFNISSEQVDDILSKQQRSWFFPGPQHQT